MRNASFTGLLLLILGAGLAWGQAKDQPAGGMKTYATKYYDMHTDLGPDDAMEAAIRMTKMAEEYHERTKGFAGAITGRLPFYLYSKADDYYKNGGIGGSAGVFIVDAQGQRLMAIAGEKTSGTTWHVVQHEGFHQFAHAVIRGDLPIWVNEGLAEYFGEGLWTGDGFVTGVVPPWRLARLKKLIDSDGVRSIKDMMLMSHKEWVGQLSINNYDEAWSMVHFLAHGEDGKYQKAFSSFIGDLGKGRPWATAWQNNFGDASKFEDRWKEYWLAQPDNPTADLYAKAHASTLTSFLARAYTQKQTFDSFEEFIKDAGEGKLKAAKEDWLPATLLQETLKGLEADGKWSIEPDAKKQPQIVVVMADETRITGSFIVAGAKFKEVRVELDDSAPRIAEAKALIADKKMDRAKGTLQDLLKQNPKSPRLPEIRQLLQDTRGATSKPAKAGG